MFFYDNNSNNSKADCYVTVGKCLFNVLVYRHLYSCVRQGAPI